MCLFIFTRTTTQKGLNDFLVFRLIYGQTCSTNYYSATSSALAMLGLEAVPARLWGVCVFRENKVFQSVG